jgi:acylglycerol lipase
MSLFKKVRIIASSIFRPYFPVVEYYRDGMTGTDDPLFNFKFTLRFMTMMDKSELYLPENFQIPVLVITGDKDELFDV